MARLPAPTATLPDEGAPKGSSFVPGDLVAGRYRILARLGAGAMGAVYRALDEARGELVALKVLHQSAVKPRRFEREVAALRELSSSGIVRYLGHGATASGAPFLVTELLEGVTLLDRLGKGPLPAGEVLAMARRVAEALALAHEHGIVHRDVKPDNLFLVGGRLADVKVLDFGVARPVMDPEGPTQTGSVVGTPGYMAPEQVRGARDVDARADVFGLGCVLYEALSGEPAFYANDLLALLSRILFDEPRPLREARRGISPALDALVGRMLAKDRERRPSSAEVAAILRRIDEDGLLEERRTGPTPGEAPPPAVPALTDRELKLISVVVAARALSVVAQERAEDAEERTTTANPLEDADDPRLLALRESLEPFGARVEALVDGSVVATLLGEGSATDRAALAARCALAMRRALPEAPMSLATGLGDVTGRLPIGDAIDRAALLARAAARGAVGEGDRPDFGRELRIRLDPVTAGLLDARFVVTELGAASCLAGLRDAPTGTRPHWGRVAFVGRNVELGALVAAYDRCVHAHAAGLAVVIGAPGFGKTRLAAELVHRLAKRSWRDAGAAPEIWSARADDVKSHAALGLLAQLVRAASGIIEGESLFIRQTKIAAFVDKTVGRERALHLTAFVSELAGAPLAAGHNEEIASLRREPELLRARLAGAFRELVCARAEARPVVLSVDDLQWADAASIAALEALVAEVEDRRVFVLALGRPELVAAAPGLLDTGEIVQLGPLPDDEVRALAHASLGASADPAAIEWIVREGRGVPLLVEELVRSAAEGRAGQLPPTVLAVARARLDALGAKDRRVLRAASILGNVFRVEHVRALLGGVDGCPDLETRLEDLARLQLVEPRPVGLAGPEHGSSAGEVSWAFCDVAVRQAAYDSLTDSDRTLGHRLAAELLGADPAADPLALARHLERAGEPGRAGRSYARAAEHALSSGDVRAAIAHAERAVDCGSTGEVLGSMRLLQAEAHAWSGALPDVLAHTEEALAALPKGSPRHFLAATRVAIAKSRLGDAAGLRSAASAVEQALNRSDPDRAIFVAAIELAIHLADVGRADRALQIAERIEQMAPRVSPGSRELDGRLAAMRASVARHVGQPDSALVALGRSIELFEEARNVRWACEQRSRLGAAFVELGARERAEAVLSFNLGEIERHGVRGAEPRARTAMAAALALRKAHADGRAHAEAAVARSRELHDRSAESAALAVVAALSKDVGDAAAAESAARASLEAAVSPPDRLTALATLASVLIARHLYGPALEAAHEAVELLDALAGSFPGESLARLSYAVALGAAGQRSAALEQLRIARERLLSRAAALGDSEDRRRFLENVPEHARTIELARASLGEPA